MEFAAKIKAPIVHALRGKEHVEWDNPFDVGMTGLIGFSSGYRAMLSCDTLLMLATYHGHAGAVELLLQAGADTERVNDAGRAGLR